MKDNKSSTLQVPTTPHVKQTNLMLQNPSEAARKRKLSQSSVDSPRLRLSNKIGRYPLHKRALSSTGRGDLIDTMEKEQEGIVLKLMKEIDSLREENFRLKNALSKSINTSVVASKPLPTRSKSLDDQRSFDRHQKEESPCSKSNYHIVLGV